jgi:hypothetical protein
LWRVQNNIPKWNRGRVDVQCRNGCNQHQGETLGNTTCTGIQRYGLS